MKRFSDMKSHAKLALLGGALALAAGPAGALDVYLATKAYLKTLPDGSMVPMWGYVLDADGDANGVGDCWEAADETARSTCIDGLGDPTLPGPRLTVPPTDASLTINLSNGLSEPTSVLIPGQALPVGSAATFIEPADPTAVAATGLRTTATQRVRSYGNEAPANGGTQTYSWNLARSGTFLYHSGTWPQKQVYMGLFGAVTKDFATGQVYEGVPYDSEAVLFYSEIDPVLNASIADGTYTTSIEYHPQWFLVNGEPYVAGMADIPAGTVGGNTLLRFLSAAGETHVPTLQGLYMTIHGEDGIRYGWEDTAAGTSGFSPREQYTAELPPLKTKDAILAAPATEGRYALYDGNGYMTNPSNPDDFGVSDTVGGMLRFLAFAPNALPVVTAPTPDPLAVTAPFCATSVPASDAVITAWLASATATDAEDGTLPVTNDAPTDFPIGGTLVTFSATDSASAVGTASATVQVAATANTAPSVTAPAPLTLNVPSGTTSVDATDPAIVAWLASATASDLEDGPLSPTNDAPASFPAALDPGATTTVTFTATDACGLPGTGSSTVTIVEAAANIAPVAIDDSAYVTNQDTPLIVAAPGVLGNDSDADSGPVTLAASLVSNVTNGTLVLDSTGGFTYTPNTGFFGTDSFTYVAFDGADNSAPATVTITVNQVGAPAITLYFSTTGNSNPPGVTGTADNADIYRYDSAAATPFSRVADVTALGAAGTGLNLPGVANVDGLVFVDATHFYVSFAAATTTIARPGPDLVVEDEDIVYFDGSSWSLYFDATAAGLGAAGGLDIDAFDILAGTLYFSTVGTALPPGATGPGDDSDIYRWNGGSSFTKVFDGSANGLPPNADIDALQVVDETHFYLSFTGAGTTQEVTVTGLGVAQDEDVLEFNAGSWSVYFDGTAAGLTANGQDIDAIQVP